MSEETRKSLIIGCGYLGRRVARSWRSAGNDVIALTRSSSHAEEFLRDGIQPVVGNVLDPHALRTLPAAETALYAVGYDRAQSASKREVYIEGVRNVLDALPPTVSHLIYVSSTSVYGQSNGETIDETSACDPTSEGGRICLDAEHLVRERLDGRIPVSVLRLSGIYGPGRLLARIAGLREGRPLGAHPEGWLNLIHVADAALTVVQCADRLPSHSDTLLVSDDRPIKRRMYYELLAKLADAPAPRFQTTDGEPADLGKRCCNRRLHDVLGAELTFPSIETGLPDAISE